VGACVIRNTIENYFYIPGTKVQIANMCALKLHTGYFQFYFHFHIDVMKKFIIRLEECYLSGMKFLTQSIFIFPDKNPKNSITINKYFYALKSTFRLIKIGIWLEKFAARLFCFCKSIKIS